MQSNATVCGEDGCHSGSGGAYNPGGDCWDHPMQFSLPVQEGASFDFNQAWSFSAEGVPFTVTPNIQFTLSQTVECAEKPPLDM